MFNVHAYLTATRRLMAAKWLPVLCAGESRGKLSRSTFVTHASRRGFFIVCDTPTA
jgi:hypothetical protein